MLRTHTTKARGKPAAYGSKSPTGLQNLRCLLGGIDFCMHISYRSTWRLALVPVLSRRQSHRCQQLPFCKKRGAEGILRMVPTQWRQQRKLILLIFLVRGAHITYRHWRVTFDACAYGNGESVNHDGATRGTERRYRDLVHNQATSARELAPAAQRSPTYPCSPELIITSHRFIVRWHRG